MSNEGRPGATRTEAFLQIAAVAALAVGCVMVLQPFLSAILTALVLVSSTWPVYARLRRLVRGRDLIAAGLMTGGLVLSVLAPVVWLAWEGIAQVPQLVTLVRAYLEARDFGPPTWVAELPMVGGWLAGQWDALTHDRERLLQLATSILDPAQAVLVEVGVLLGQGIAQTAIALLVGFFLFKDGDHLMVYARAGLDRVTGGLGDELLAIVHGTVQSVVLGIAGTAFAQGAVALVGFLVLGVPGALLLGAATAGLSLVPVGPPLVWGGASAWLFSQGRVGAGIILIIYGVTLISGIDNVVKPLLISRGGTLPFVLVFFGVLGGVLAFGFTGVFLGPSFLAVGLALYGHWTRQARLTEEEQA